MDQGWIKLDRNISQHWIWSDPIKLKWWIDMLLTVNFIDSKVNFGNQLIECKRGQSLLSLQSWGDRWKVDKNKVRNFFVLLEKDSMILHENLSKTTRITICKYDSYRSIENAIETQSKRNRNAIETQSKTIEERKELKEGEDGKNNTLDEFDFIWNLYGKKGNRSVSLNKFSKLKSEEKDLVQIHIPVYIESVKEKQYLKNFETYLNQRHWETEINGVLVTEKKELIEYVTYEDQTLIRGEKDRASYENMKKAFAGGGYIFEEIKTEWR